MTPQQFKKIAILLKRVYKELEAEAVDSGLSVGSPKFQEALDKARALVLENNGFTLEQYQEARLKMEAYTPADLMGEFEKLRQQVADIVIPTIDQITTIASAEAKKYVKAPEIINKIVREVQVRQPQIIKETTIEKTVQEVAYNEDALNSKIDGLTKHIDSLPKPVDESALRKEFQTFFHDNFGENFKKNIAVFNMPDFRRLAIGLREDIDQRVVGTSDNKTVPKITVSAMEPTNPKLYDLWVDIS